MGTVQPQSRTPGVKRSNETGEAPPRLPQVAGVYRERPPAPALCGHVDRVWTNELSGPAEIEVVPDGCIDIYWTGSRLQVAGPNTWVVTATIASAAVLAGIRFRPGVAVRWLGVSAAELLNTHPALEDCWGRRATARLSEAIAQAKTAMAVAAMLERSLVDRLYRVAPADPMINATVAAAAHETPSPNGIVRELVDDFGWSERTLRRRCQEAFGYGPKTLERILRFQRFLHLLSNSRTPLSVLAVEAGYADQAHLAREVRRLSGQTPRILMAQLQS
jgi:AraC-like DNA-binding protein